MNSSASSAHRSVRAGSTGRQKPATSANSPAATNYAGRFSYLQQLSAQCPALLPILNGRVSPLIRNDLTVLERSISLARRKEIYEALHPETKRPEGGRHQKNAEIISTFAADTAARAGVTERSVQQEVQIAQQISPPIREQLPSVIRRALQAWARGRWRQGNWPFFSPRDTWIIDHAWATVVWWSRYPDGPPSLAWGPMFLPPPEPFQPTFPADIFHPLSASGEQAWAAFATRAERQFREQLRAYRRARDTIYGLHRRSLDRDATLVALFQLGSSYDVIAAHFQRQGWSLTGSAVRKAIREFAGDIGVTVRTQDTAPKQGNRRDAR